MAESVDVAEIDVFLTNLRGTRIVLCSAEPTTLAEAITTYALTDEDHANAALTAPNHTLANGDVSGRKDTLAQKVDIPINASGIADHCAHVTATELKKVFTVPAQQLTSGGTVTINAHKLEVQQPS